MRSNSDSRARWANSERSARIISPSRRFLKRSPPVFLVAYSEYMIHCIESCTDLDQCGFSALEVARVVPYSPRSHRENQENQLCRKRSANRKQSHKGARRTGPNSTYLA